MRLAGVPRGFVLFFVVLWAVGMLLGVGWRYDPAGRSIALTLVIASTVILLWVSLIAPILLPPRIWKANPAAKRRTNIQITADGFTVEQDTASSTYKWAAVMLAIEGKRAFVLYASPAILSTPVLVPKRALQPEDITLVRELIRSHVPRRYKR